MENIAKALRVLKLPDTLAPYNGAFYYKESSFLVEKRVNDFTKRVGGKPTVTSTFEVRKVVSNTTGYGFNLLSDFIHEFGYTLISDTLLDKKQEYAVTPSGPFSGQTYWYPEGRLTMTATEAGAVFKHVYNPFKNTTLTGWPEITKGENPSISILREDYIKTSSGLSTKPSKSYPSYRRDELIKLSGMSYTDIKEAYADKFSILNGESSINVKSVGVAVEVAETSTPDNEITSHYTGSVYYNGIDTRDFKPSGLLTSYNKVYPGHVTRWILYNGAINFSAYGATWMIQEPSSTINTINVVAGTEFSWNLQTRTLTYNSNIPAQLHFQYEELPAQGKNQSALEIIQLS